MKTIGCYKLFDIIKSYESVILIGPADDKCERFITSKTAYGKIEHHQPNNLDIVVKFFRYYHTTQHCLQIEFHVDKILQMNDDTFILYNDTDLYAENFYLMKLVDSHV